MIGASNPADRRERWFYATLNHLGFQADWAWFRDVLEANPGKDRPYHGNDHLITTANNTYEGAGKELIGPKWQRIAFIAAVFHDYNHTGGPDHDSVNINRAVHAFANIRRQAGTPTFITRYDSEIVNLIEQTVFPHVHATNMAAAVLQDADVMQTFEPDRATFIEGLRQETGRPLTDDDAREFVANHRMNTTWGRGRQLDYLDPTRNR